VTLVEKQTAQAMRDVAQMIRLSGQTARLFRPGTAGTGSFYGPHETTETEVAVIPIEMKALSPQDLAEIGSDAVASALPDCGIKEQDFLRIDSTRYRVTEVKPQNLFGAITHLDLHLELEKREAGHV
jgi:hypothetical protein